MQTKFKIVLCVIVVFITIITTDCMYRCRDTKDIIKDTEKVTEESVAESTTENTAESIVENDEESTVESTINKEESTIETETDKEVDTNQATQPISLGNFKLTAYCSCEKCCGKWANNRPVDEDGNEIVYGSIGTRLVAGVSIAVDPKVIPYKSEVIINGHTYIAHDTGGAIKGNRIDIYMPSHEEALDFGVKYAEVFVVKK